MPSFYKQTTLPDLTSQGASVPLPEKIGPYSIDCLLNTGGMSLLYLGIHPETKQPLAIKVLSPTHVTHPEAVARFLEESAIIGLTNHPNIVKLYGEGRWDQGLYIAMEFIRGISLRQFIIQQSLSLKRALEIILQVAYALLHLHSHGVIHRDLKPENILITEDGSVKVIDFGIAQLQEETATPPPAEQSTKPASLLGTPNYMSPEQKENSAKVSYASDIYSLGIIAYELVLGKLSFGHISLPLLPKGLRKIVAKALAISVKERYQDITDFISDISLYLKSKEIEKDRPGSDQLKEVYEVLQKGSQTLSPLLVPEWPQMDIGIAKLQGMQQLGLYYDFFKLPNQTYLIAVGKSLSTSLDAGIYIGVLRGMLKTLLYGLDPKGVLRPMALATSLNQMLSQDLMQQPFALSLTLLDPFRDRVLFFSSGLDNLFHLPQGEKSAKKLSSHNPLLGLQQTSEFSEISDNWLAGDTLIIPALDISSALEPLLIDAIEKQALLSPQRQAEAILKQIASSPHFSLQRAPKALITIQRLA